MKQTINFLFLNLIFISYPAFSQQRDTMIEKKAIKETYIYKLGDKDDPAVVYKKNSIPPRYLGTRLKQKEIDEFKLIDQKSFSKSISEVFSRERLEQLKNSFILLTLYLTESGRIEAISYIPDPEITVYEIEKLEYALRKNVAFYKFNIIDDNGDVLPPWVLNIRFERILDGSFRY